MSADTSALQRTERGMPEVPVDGMSQNSVLANPLQCQIVTLAPSSGASLVLHHSFPADLVTNVNKIYLVRDWSAEPVLHCTA